MKKILQLFLLTIFTLSVTAQSDSSLIKKNSADSSKLGMNMDAVYNRPFTQVEKTPVSIGGYVEANSSYFQTEGVTEGIAFQLPRLTIFVASSIKNRIKFLSEIELEEGGRKINIEFASIDIQFHPIVNLRGGIIINPIGSFNQNHDGPKWEFISRPISATTIIPSTWSNVGFGIFGKYAINNFIWAYEFYLTNGFDESIISNPQNKTWLAASKANSERFEKSFNGVPLVTSKTAFRHRRIGEIGFSWMGGVYNKFQDDGLALDSKRRVDLFAIDFNSTLSRTRTLINVEWVWAKINVPETYTQQYGNRQQGGFIDIVQPVISRAIFGWENSIINFAFRIEYADYNIGTYAETGGNIYDHIFAISPGVCFRLSAQTVIRANYRYHWERDLLGNQSVKTAGFQFGFSTYF